jgi:hypothetical protein
MRHATQLWTLWQALLKPFAAAFTRLGYRRVIWEMSNQMDRPERARHGE